MKQFLLPYNTQVGACLSLGGADLHYLSHVRRMKFGDTLICRTPDGAEVTCLVEKIDQAVMTIKVMAVNIISVSAGKNPIALHLIQGIPKGKKLDMIISQAVQLGVSSILPLQCRNSVAELDERWDRKKTRFQGIIKEAIQQSGSLGMTELLDPCSLGQFLSQHPLPKQGLGLFLHEQLLEQSSLHGYLEGNPTTISLVVGPEGGLAPEEVKLLLEAGFKPIYLGKQILRTETAAIVGLGALRIIVQERPYWSLKDKDN